MARLADLADAAAPPADQEYDRERSHHPAWLSHAYFPEAGLMEEPRIKVSMWIQMALRMGDRDGRPGTVIRRGDADAGGILLVLRRGNEVSVLSQVRAAGESAWMRATGPESVDDATADAYIARQVQRDPDLWVVEFIAPDLLPPFEARLV